MDSAYWQLGLCSLDNVCRTPAATEDLYQKTTHPEASRILLRAGLLCRGTHCYTSLHVCFWRPRLGRGGRDGSGDKAKCLDIRYAMADRVHLDSSCHNILHFGIHNCRKCGCGPCGSKMRSMSGSTTLYQGICELDELAAMTNNAETKLDATPQFSGIASKSENNYTPSQPIPSYVPPTWQQPQIQGIPGQVSLAQVHIQAQQVKTVRPDLYSDNGNLKKGLIKPRSFSRKSQSTPVLNSYGTPCQKNIRMAVQRLLLCSLIPLLTHIPLVISSSVPSVTIPTIIYITLLLSLQGILNFAVFLCHPYLYSVWEVARSRSIGHAVCYIFSCGPYKHQDRPKLVAKIETSQVRSNSTPMTVGAIIPSGLDDDSDYGYSEVDINETLHEASIVRSNTEFGNFSSRTDILSDLESYTGDPKRNLIR